MRHLHLVPTPAPTTPETRPATLPAKLPPAVATLLEEAEQLHLQLAGLPPVDAALTAASDTDTDEVVLPELTPELRTMFGQMDLLLDGLDAQRRTRALDTLYFDADNVPRARSENLRVL